MLDFRSTNPFKPLTMLISLALSRIENCLFVCLFDSYTGPLSRGGMRNLFMMNVYVICDAIYMFIMIISRFLSFRII